MLVYSLSHTLLAAHPERHSVRCCKFTSEEKSSLSFLFKERKPSSDVVKAKHLTAKGVRHNPEHKTLCRTPVGAAHTIERSKNLVCNEQHIARL